MICSMSRKGDCWDNAPMESFFATLKGELVDGRDYLTRDEARADVFQYVEGFYNRRPRIRKRIEEAFGWAKTAAGMRKARHRGLPKIDWQFTLAMAAYNLIRLPKLLGAAA